MGFFVPALQRQLAAGELLGFGKGVHAKGVLAQRIERVERHPLQPFAFRPAPFLEPHRVDQDVSQKLTAVECSGLLELFATGGALVNAGMLMAPYLLQQTLEFQHINPDGRSRIEHHRIAVSHQVIDRRRVAIGGLEGPAHAAQRRAQVGAGRWRRPRHSTRAVPAHRAPPLFPVAWPGRRGGRARCRPRIG